MQKISFPSTFPRGALWLLSASAVVLLSACGGSDSAQSGPPQLSPLFASATTTVQLAVASLPDGVAQQTAQTLFHVAPVLLDDPQAATAAGSGMTSMHAHRQILPADAGSIATRGLTVAAMESIGRMRSKAMQTAAPQADAAPMATSGVVSTFTPAQIRAAYGLPALPAAGSVLTATQAAQLGAGQTIYLIDAKHDPSVVAELAAFNTKFALPGCTTKILSATVSLPLAPASVTSGCEFSVVSNTTAGALSATTPAYDAGWATEITLDVQWAHATAPLARIILIEAPDASLSSLLGGVKLANAMGPGVVSMSFGAAEGSWTATADATFTAPNMTYLAATGDAGSAVNWPAVSSHVLAVGGTTLTYSGAAARTETAWSGTGGGISAYVSTPAYQNAGVPGMGSVARRNVADVAFNANPSSGQYVAVIVPGSTQVSWVSAGGTSLATPQWAGIIAIANAARALALKPVLGAPHTVLYGQVASVPGLYASTFADITQGANGSCAACVSKIGYDQPTGLGTPNVNSLLSTLSGLSVVASAPVVTPAIITGQVGTALSFMASVSAASPVSYAISGAPAGMVIAQSGAVTWSAPVAGAYAVTVTATDSQTGLSGQGLYNILIVAPTAPQIAAATVSGRTGVTLSYAIPVTSAHSVTFSMTGAPPGLTLTATGTLNWAAPVAGTWAVTVTVKDTTTALTSQALYTLSIATTGPVISAAAMNGIAGTPLYGTLVITDPGASSLSVSIAGAPMGMTFSISGMTIVPAWINPVAGTYRLIVTAVDSSYLSAQSTVPITISAR